MNVDNCNIVEGFTSENFEERRSYTPEPRLIKLMGVQKIGQLDTNRSMFNAANKSSLSAINAKSEFDGSEIGENLLQYISKSKRSVFLKANFDPFTGRSVTFDV